MHESDGCSLGVAETSSAEAVLGTNFPTHSIQGSGGRTWRKKHRVFCKNEPPGPRYIPRCSTWKQSSRTSPLAMACLSTSFETPCRKGFAAVAVMKHYRTAHRSPSLSLVSSSSESSAGPTASISLGESNCRTAGRSNWHQNVHTDSLRRIATREGLLSPRFAPLPELVR